MELVQEPAALMIMYSAAAVGWLLNIVMAPIMSAYLAVRHESKVRSISSRQESLIKEWGSAVKGQATVQTASQDPIEQATAAGGDILADESDTVEDPVGDEEVAT